jgi:hypothetical protein
MWWTAGGAAALLFVAWRLQKGLDAAQVQVTPEAAGAALTNAGQWIPGLWALGAVVGSNLGGNQLPPLTLNAQAGRGYGNRPARLL